MSEKPYEYPEECPSCGGPVVEQNTLGPAKCDDCGAVVTRLDSR